EFCDLRSKDRIVELEVAVVTASLKARKANLHPERESSRTTNTLRNLVDVVRRGDEHRVRLLDFSVEHVQERPFAYLLDQLVKLLEDHEDASFRLKLVEDSEDLLEGLRRRVE